MATWFQINSKINKIIWAIWWASGATDNVPDYGSEDYIGYLRLLLLLPTFCIFICDTKAYFRPELLITIQFK